ncbi:MAG: alpha-galactosidase, partial [Armatimonadetes bacterium]|nr:alpha-galactosidase [Candidatus Hippobium faecium]
MKFIEDYIKNQGAIIPGSSIEIISQKCQWDCFGFNNRTFLNKKLANKTQEFETGIMAHAPSEIIINVREYDKVSFYPAVFYFDDVPEVSTIQDLGFYVYGDNKEIFKTITDAVTESEFAELSIAEFNELKLVTTKEGKGCKENTFWGNLTFTKKDGTKVVAGEAANNAFFSFKYNGIPSDELLPKWDKKFETVDLGDITRYVTTYTDPETKFACIIEMHTYKGFTNYWWNVKFANRGDKNSYLLSDVKSIDFDFTSSVPKVTHALGSTFSATDFNATTEIITDKLHIATTGGRSSEGAWPYFRMENPNYIMAMGWSGQWYCDFVKSEKGIKVLGGIETFASVLYPGEEIKMPSINIMSFEGSVLDAHNDWRKFILKYNTPGGENVRVPVSLGTWGGMYADKHIETADYIADNELGYDVYWIDAAWYGDPEHHCLTAWEPGWGEARGNWYENPVAYPEGFGPVTDKIHERGFKFLLWFEMQSARPNTQLTNEHPDWFIKNIIKEGKSEEVIDWQFNIGDDEACDWLIDFIDEKIKKWKIDWYREDFNTNPLPYWQYMDTLDSERVGMCEVKCVDNYWRFWDTLSKRNPGLLIDNCASGGRRLDIEMIGRGITLWQSDYQCYSKVDYMGVQSQNMNLNLWLPLHTGGNNSGLTQNKYGFRSCMSTGMDVDLYLNSWDGA